jgi:hypothetical protein
MARFRCRACGQEGETTRTGTSAPLRRADVVFALGIDELPDEFVDPPEGDAGDPDHSGRIRHLDARALGPGQGAAAAAAR